MTLLTLAEFRGLDPAAAFDDAALGLLLDAAEDEITRAAGPVSVATEIITSGGRLIVLARRAASVNSITETHYSSGVTTTLATDDYLAWPGGYVLERLLGTHPRITWFGRVAVEYVPVDDVNIRKGVQYDLVRLMINYAPGLTSETVGSWTTQIASNATWNASEERQAILARLVEAGRMAVA